MNRNECFKILEISPTTNTDEIKKAYKKMALRYHPDKNKEEGSEKKFQKISEAYQLLINPQPQMNVERFNSHDDIIRQFFGNNRGMFMNINRNTPFQQFHMFHPNMRNNSQRNVQSRSSSIFFEGNKKIEIIKETINGVTTTKKIITNI